MSRTRVPCLANVELGDKMDLPLAQLTMSVRTLNFLESVGILHVRDLLKHKPEELMEIPNFGTKALEEVYKSLASLGFSVV